jgi:hypothetical protein
MHLPKHGDDALTAHAEAFRSMASKASSPSNPRRLNCLRTPSGSIMLTLPDPLRRELAGLRAATGRPAEPDLTAAPLGSRPLRP